MSLSCGIRFLMEPQRSLAFGSIGTSYMSIGSALTKPIRMYELHNLTDISLQFSIDGIEDHFPLPANGHKVIDVVSNNTSNTTGWYIGIGTSFYVKQLGLVAPSYGSVYLCTAYGE
jgi:hypothetical protein